MKNLHESITRFFENPTREKFRELVQFNTGEYNNLDFKKEWPDAAKMARHILAFSNSGGGIIVVGIEETEEKKLISCGISKIQDKANIDSQISPFLPEGIEYDIVDFSYSSSDYAELVGKSFQVMMVEYDPKRIPLVSKKDGNGIKENAIYIRKGTSSLIANYEQLQKLLNNRIATNYNTSSEIKLEEHLVQLKLLYDKINKYNYVYIKPNGKNSEGILTSVGKFFDNLSTSIYGEKKVVKNPNYPSEDYEEFIARMIAKKKTRIEALLDV